MAGTPVGGPVGCLDDVYACVYIHECVRAYACPDYAGIIAGRWGKQSLKVRVVWLISSSLYHFN